LESLIKSRYSTNEEGKKIGKRVIENVNQCLRPHFLDQSLNVDLHILKQHNKYRFYLKTNKQFYDLKKPVVASNFNYSLGSHVFEPKYDIVLIDGNSYRIIVDIPGQYTILTGVSDKEPLIILRGKKMLGFQDQEKKTEYTWEKCYYQTREFGNFELKIPLLEGFEKVSLENIKRTRKDGYFELIVEKLGCEKLSFVED